jgi:CDP-paratose 2-epimerase
MAIPINSNEKPVNGRPVMGMVEWFRPGEETQVAQVLAELKELGITELRTGISWAEYYTPAGKEWFDWLIPHLAAYFFPAGLS